MILKETNIGRLILESISDKTTEKKASKKVDASEIRKVAKGLTKIAAIPYNEAVYKSVQELMKIAAEYLEDSAHELENSIARQAELEKAIDIASLLDDMISYGIIDPEETEEKIAELSKKSDKEIEIIKTAMDMIKAGKRGANLFEFSKSASTIIKKRGMFDAILD